MSQAFNFIFIDGTPFTGSFSIFPITFPSVSGSYIVNGDPFSSSIAPASFDLVPNTFKVEAIGPFRGNDWFISSSASTVTASSAIVSGSYSTGSLCSVTFNTIDNKRAFDAYRTMSIRPASSNAGFNDSFVFGDTRFYTTDQSGSLTVNLVPQTYTVHYFGGFQTEKYTILVPATASVNAATCISTTYRVSPIVTPQNQANVGPTYASADIRYAFKDQQFTHSVNSDTASYLETANGTITSDANGLFINVPITSPQILGGLGETAVYTKDDHFLGDNQGNPKVLFNSDNNGGGILYGLWSGSIGNAVTASKALVANTASYVSGSNVKGDVATASYSVSASNAAMANAISFVPTVAASASVASSSISASFATTAGTANAISFTPATASYAVSSSISANSLTSSFITASNVQGAVTSAATASLANAISFVPATASFATNANTAASASSITFTPSLATSASYVSGSVISNGVHVTASTAPYVDGNFAGTGKSFEIVPFGANSGNNGDTTIKLYTSRSSTSAAEFGVDVDPSFTPSEAVYICPPADSNRMYFGRSGRRFYSVNWTNVINWEGTPAIILQNTSVNASWNPNNSASLIGNDVPADLMLVCGAGNYITNAQSHLKKSNLAFKSYCTDTESFARPQAYEFDTYGSASQMTTVKHTKWYVAGVPIMTLQVTGELGLGTISPSASFQVNCVSGSSKGIIVKATGSQAANLMEFQNNTGSVLSYVDKSGVFNGTASFATSASWAPNQFALTTGSTYPVTASWANNSQTSSFVTGSNVKGTVSSSTVALNLNNTFVQTNGNGLGLQDSVGSVMGITGASINIIYNPTSSIPPFTLNNVGNNPLLQIDKNGNLTTSGYVSASVVRTPSVTNQTASLLLTGSLTKIVRSPTVDNSVVWGYENPLTSSQNFYVKAGMLRPDVTRWGISPCDVTGSSSFAWGLEFCNNNNTVFQGYNNNSSVNLTSAGVVDMYGNGGITCNNTVTFNMDDVTATMKFPVASATVPTTTSTPAGWINILIAGVPSWIPYYQ